jgi:hypothetical protein
MSRPPGATFSISTTIASIHAAGMLAWLNPEAFEAKLTAQLDALPEHDGCLTDDQQAKALADVDREIEALQRGEEKLIEIAFGHGLDILRRATAD